MMLDVAEQAGQMPRLADLGAGLVPAAAQTVAASGIAESGGSTKLPAKPVRSIEAMAVTEFPPPPPPVCARRERMR